MEYKKLIEEIENKKKGNKEFEKGCEEGYNLEKSRNFFHYYFELKKSLNHCDKNYIIGKMFGAIKYIFDNGENEKDCIRIEESIFSKKWLKEKLKEISK
jgi:hypothetical protein